VVLIVAALVTVYVAVKRWAGEQEGPLARGAAAEKLIERAKAWAEQHVGSE
jgi:hypothetical protein